MKDKHYDVPDDVIELPNGDLCIAATTVSFGAGSKDMYLIWTDASGNEFRSKTYGGPDLDGCTKLLVMDNGELMLHGYTRNFGAVSRDLYLIRLSEQGDSLWSKRLGAMAMNKQRRCFARRKVASCSLLIQRVSTPITICMHSSSMLQAK